MEPTRAVFWEKESLGSKYRMKQNFMWDVTHACEEGNAFTMKVNIHSSRKMEQ